MRPLLLAAFLLCLTSSLAAQSQEYLIPKLKTTPVLTSKDSKEILALIENQLTALQNHDFIGAYDKYTSKEFRAATNPEQFKWFIESHPAFTENKSSLFGNIELNYTIASIQGTLTALNGKTSRVVYYFIKEDGGWKIIGIKPLEAASPQ